MIKLRSVFIFILLSAIVAMGTACSSKESSSQMAGAKEEGKTATMQESNQPAAAAEQQGQSTTEMLPRYIAPKWISADGLNFWMVFSGTDTWDRFNMIPGRFQGS